MATCLIVDDSRVVRIVARKIFEELKFICHEAENGQEALNKVHEDIPDVIFLDWNMPIMTGIEFLRILRAETKLSKQPKIIFCTTENDFAKITEAITAGADEYIMKPFDSDTVKSKLSLVGLL
jgi:two-component system chemotaxis response regulator CheY